MTGTKESEMIWRLERPVPFSVFADKKDYKGNYYLGSKAVRERLNEVFPFDWSFEILKTELVKEEQTVLVQGFIQIHSLGIRRSAIAGHRVNKNDLSNSLKAAGTQCFKKCAMMLGVGEWLTLQDKETAEKCGQFFEDLMKVPLETQKKAISKIRSCDWKRKTSRDWQKSIDWLARVKKMAA